MKILNRIAATACLFGAVLLVSCESPDLSTAHESQVNGLLNVTIQIPDNPTEFYATKKGPYEEGEEITVKVPTTDEDPLDVSRLICTVRSIIVMLFRELGVKWISLSLIK